MPEKVRPYLSDGRQTYIGTAPDAETAADMRAYFAYYQGKHLDKTICQRVELEQVEAQRLRANCKTINDWRSFSKTWRKKLAKGRLRRVGVGRLRGVNEIRGRPVRGTIHKVHPGTGIKFFVGDMRKKPKKHKPLREEWLQECDDSRGLGADDEEVASLTRYVRKESPMQNPELDMLDGLAIIGEEWELEVEPPKAPAPAAAAAVRADETEAFDDAFNQLQVSEFFTEIIQAPLFYQNERNSPEDSAFKNVPETWAISLGSAAPRGSTVIGTIA
jgi:hypothetical protein